MLPRPAPRKGALPALALLGIGALASCTLPAEPSITPVVTIVAPAPAVAPPALATATVQPRVWVQVDNTSGQGVLVRVRPGSDLIVGGWLDETYLEIVGEDVNINGQVWRNVRGPDGSVGWVSAQYLIRARITPTPGPTETPTPLPPTQTPTPGPTATPTATPLPLGQIAFPALTTTPTVFTAAPAIERELRAAGFQFTAVIGREGNGNLALYARPANIEQAQAWLGQMGFPEKRALVETIARLLKEAFPDETVEAHVQIDNVTVATARMNARGGFDVSVSR
jgi:hypothetical protein